MQKNNFNLTGQKITKVEFSKDGKFAAVAIKKNSDIYIFFIEQLALIKSWKLTHIIRQHIQYVYILSFSNIHLLTASFDRGINIFKMNFSLGKPINKELVEMPNNNGFLCGQWSRNGKKFILGSVDKYPYIGCYSQIIEGWIGEYLSGSKSGITSIAFHESGKVIAVGSADGTLRLISCVYTEEMRQKDKIKDNPEDSEYRGVFQKVNDFDVELLKVSNLQWVNDVKFLSDTQLIIITHSDSIILLNNINNFSQQKDLKKQLHQFLPFTSCQILSMNKIACAGYSKQIVQFDFNQKGISILLEGMFKFGQIKKRNLLDEFDSKTMQTKISKMKGIFEKGSNQKKNKENETIHKTCILQVKKYPRQNLLCSYEAFGGIYFWKYL